MNSKKRKYLIIASLAVILVAITTIFLVNKTLKNDTTNEESVTIPIAMAADNNYTYPTIVSITSILENANKNTEIKVYLMHPGDFKNENKEKISSLQTKYKSFKVEFINMEDKFKNAKTDSSIPTASYYRLLLPSLLPDVKKIVWLDGDTVTLKDLSKMYKLDMSNYYYRGFLDNNVDGLKDFGIENDHYICAGVMLINLDKLRKDNIEEKFEDFISKNNSKLIQHDQTVINAVCYKNIGILPPQYGIFNFWDTNAAKDHYKKLVANNKWTLKEFLKAYKDPTIIHFVVKPWKETNYTFANIWFKYAKKTLYYEDILKKYNLDDPLK